MRAVDAHVHWWPQEVLDTLRNNGIKQSEGGIWADLVGQLDYMDQTGREIDIVCTGGLIPAPICKFPLPVARDIARKYNDLMAEAQVKYPGRVFGTALLPLQDTEASVKMLEEAKKDLDLRGANLSCQVDGIAIDDDRFDDIYTRAEELDMPWFIHPTDSDNVMDLMNNHGKQGRALMGGLGRMVDSSIAVLTLILGGVLERHPRFKLVQSHAGALLPYDAGRLDKNASLRELPLHPTEYLKRTYTDTVSPLPLSTRYAIDFYGLDHVMYGTDFPCWDPKQAVRISNQIGLTTEQHEQLMGGNARRILNLSTPAAPKVKAAEKAPVFAR